MTERLNAETVAAERPDDDCDERATFEAEMAVADAGTAALADARLLLARHEFEQEVLAHHRHGLELIARTKALLAEYGAPE